MATGSITFRPTLRRLPRVLEMVDIVAADSMSVDFVQSFVQGEERSCDAEVRDIPAGNSVGQGQPMTELRVVSGTYPMKPCRFLSLKHS